MIKLKLKEGMYIRYLGNIAKIIAVLIDGNSSSLNRVYVDNETVFFSEIEKASFNIIDLIEVGDYVNGEKVTSAEPVDKNDTDRYLGFGDYDYYIHDNEDIKDVVTKEQFEAMKYVVERDK